jgi:hypothetical protein
MTDIVAVISAGAAIVGTGGGLWFALRAERRARSADARAAEAHEIAMAAHRFARLQYAREAGEAKLREWTAALVDEVYQQAARHDADGVVGIQLLPTLTAFEREAALALKGDPRVTDVTIEASGAVRIWVEGSRWPAMPH